MPLYNVNAIVIKRISLGETDRILTLLTRDHGKIGVVAKGSRRSGSRLTGASELFIHGKYLLASGKSLGIVSQVEILDTFPMVRRDMLSIARASYFCELSDRFIEEHQPDTETFDLLLNTMNELQMQTAPPEVLRHYFEMQLLILHGYTPQLDSCVRCNAITETGLSYSPSLGGILCERDRYSSADSFPVGPQTVDLLQTLSFCSRPDLTDISTSQTSLSEAARVLRWTIRFRIDRDVKSAEFLDLLLRTDDAVPVAMAS
ncbi:MAG: DNA repair protein RecO [Chthonomonadales bacterium]